MSTEVTLVLGKNDSVQESPNSCNGLRKTLVIALPPWIDLTTPFGVAVVNVYGCSFFPRTIRTWNLLPNEVVN